jgi:hypothetical protein
MLRIFIGYDAREVAAYHVFAQSILDHAAEPVMIIPLVQRQLRDAGYYWRPTDERAATEFSLTRFLIPSLCDYRGLAVFADCDMLARTDINELFGLIGKQRSQRFLERVESGRIEPAVWVCKHDYVPKSEMKMDGQVNAAYPRKNWSSFMVFDCERCTTLTRHYVNSATPAELHRFQWLEDDQIGELPLEFNWLLGEYAPNQAAKVLHWTLGGPWMKGYENADHADEWFAVAERAFPKVAA